MGTRSSFRPRPIDMGKPLPIIRSSADIKNEDAVVSRALPEVSTGVEEAEMEERHLKQALMASIWNGGSKRPELDIPIPVFRELEPVVTKADDGTNSSAWFTMTPEYILTSRGDKLGADDGGHEGEFPVIEYEADFEDERWMKSMQQKSEGKRELGNCTMDTVELLFDILERIQKSEKELLSLQKCEENQRWKKSATEFIRHAIYHHWADRRHRRGKPFLRHFQEPPRPNNTDMSVAFRPRENEQTASRERSRKNTYDNYRKLAILRDDMENLLDIINLVNQREQGKKILYQMTIRAICKRAVKSLLSPKASLAASLAGAAAPPSTAPASVAPSPVSSPVPSERAGPIKHKRRKAVQILERKPEQNEEEDNAPKIASLTPQQKLQKAGLDNFFFDEAGQRFLRNMRYFAGAFAAHGVNPYDHRVFSAASERNTVRENPRQPKIVDFPDQVKFCRDNSLRTCRVRGRVGRGGRLILDRVPHESEKGVKVASYPASVAVGGAFSSGLPLEKYVESPIFSEEQKFLVHPLPPVVLPGSEAVMEPYDVEVHWPSRKRMHLSGP